MQLLDFTFLLGQSLVDTRHPISFISFFFFFFLFSLFSSLVSMPPIRTPFLLFLSPTTWPSCHLPLLLPLLLPLSSFAFSCPLMTLPETPPFRSPLPTCTGHCDSLARQTPPREVAASDALSES